MKQRYKKATAICGAMLFLAAFGGGTAAVNAQLTINGGDRTAETHDRVVLAWTYSGALSILQPVAARVWRLTTDAATACPAVSPVATGEGAVGAESMGYTLVARNLSPYNDNGVAEQSVYCYIVQPTSQIVTSTPVKITTPELMDEPPVVNITAPASGSTAAEGRLINLIATATDTDADGAAFTALTYAWTAAPPNEVTLTSTDALTTTFTVSPMRTAAAEVTFTLTVTGSGGGEGSDSVQLTIGGMDDAPMLTTATATPPRATATTDAQNPVRVVLTAAATDAERQTLTYQWTQVENMAGAALTTTANMVELADDNTATATFSTPSALVVDAAGVMQARDLPLVLYFQVEVGDGTERDTDVTRVVMVEITAPGGGGQQVHNAVLPQVLRGITDTIHKSIYDRIKERQVQDGFWKE